MTLHIHQLLASSSHSLPGQLWRLHVPIFDSTNGMLWFLAIKKTASASSVLIWRVLWIHRMHHGEYWIQLEWSVPLLLIQNRELLENGALLCHRQPAMPQPLSSTAQYQGFPLNIFCFSIVLLAWKLLWQYPPELRPGRRRVVHVAYLAKRKIPTACLRWSILSELARKFIGIPSSDSSRGPCHLDLRRAIMHCGVF